MQKLKTLRENQKKVKKKKWETAWGNTSTGRVLS